MGKKKLEGPVRAEDLNDCSSVLRLLETRRSASAKAMSGPGPSAEQIDRLLEIAVRVPDHGKLAPWRFIVFEKDARTKVGDILASRWAELYPAHGDDMLAMQRATFERAPLVIGVVSHTVEHPKVPEIEQILSAGAVCHNMLLAATAMGFAAQWISGWYAYDRPVLDAIGLDRDETIAGFVYIGTSTEKLTDRPRPDHKALTSRWSGPAA